MASPTTRERILAGDLPLVHAALDGRTADVAALLADGADVNEVMGADTGGTALLVACAAGHAEVVKTLLAADAKVDCADINGSTPLHSAVYHAPAARRTEVMMTLIAAGADVDKADNAGCSPMYAACQEGHADAVTTLLAANANVDKAADNGVSPLYVACHEGHTEIVAQLLAANADLNENRECAPMATACHFGHLGIVQLLSSYGAAREFPFGVPGDTRVMTAETIATVRGHPDLLAWLIRSRHWTGLHHLEALTAKRAFDLLRAGAALLAAAAPSTLAFPSNETPLSRASALAAEGGAAEGTAAFLVLEAAKPWSRKTHKLFPAPARARAVELMLIGELLSREERYAAYGPQAVVDVWMTFVIPNAVYRGYKTYLEARCDTIVGLMVKSAILKALLASDA